MEKQQTAATNTVATPTHKHDCSRCIYLGATIGGGRIVDCYVHENGGATPDTLIARYGSDEPDYWSTRAGQARPGGHAELHAAQSMRARQLEANNPESPGGPAYFNPPFFTAGSAGSFGD